MSEFFLFTGFPLTVRSPLLPDAPSQSDDIQDYLDQTTESVRDAMVWAGPRQVVQRRRKGRGSGRTMEQWAVATSTPSHRRGRTDVSGRFV